MLIIKFLSAILLLIIVIELMMYPRLGYIFDPVSNDRWIVLWYGRNWQARQYVKLFIHNATNEK